MNYPTSYTVLYYNNENMMIELSHLVWSEEFRPLTIEECILPKHIKESMLGFIQCEALPHLLLTGSSGIGKTTIAKAIVSQLGYETMIVNGSNEGRLIDTLRTKIMPFASTMSFDGVRKCVIIDEAENMSKDTQMACRNFFDTYSINCTFILTANFKNLIIDPIVSRCTTVDFTVSKKEADDLTKQMYTRILEILKIKNVSYDKVAVGKIVKKNFPDFRKTLNELQRFASTGSIDASALSASESSGIEELIEILRDKNFGEMRKWVASCPNLDMSSINRKLYDKASTFVINENLPELIIHLADYSYKNAFVSDVEINIAAMLTRIMMDCEMK